jgi:hypothetical protein
MHENFSVTWRVMANYVATKEHQAGKAEKEILQPASSQVVTVAQASMAHLI